MTFVDINQTNYDDDEKMENQSIISNIHLILYFLLLETDDDYLYVLSFFSLVKY